MPTVLAWASGLCNPFSREAKAACDPACRVAPLAVLSGASSSVTAVSRDCKGHSCPLPTGQAEAPVCPAHPALCTAHCGLSHCFGPDSRTSWGSWPSPLAWRWVCRSSSRAFCCVQDGITPQAVPLSPRWKVPTAQVQLTQFQDSATSAAASLVHSSVNAQPPGPASPAGGRQPLPAALQRGAGSGAAAGLKAGPQTQQASAVVANSGWTPSTLTARGGLAESPALGRGTGGINSDISSGSPVRGLGASPGPMQPAAAGGLCGSGPGATAVARPVTTVSPRLGIAAGSSMEAASPAILQAGGSPTAYAAALQQSTLRLGLTDEQRRQSREQVAVVAAAQGSQADSGSAQRPFRATRPSLEQLKDFKVGLPELPPYAESTSSCFNLLLLWQVCKVDQLTGL